MPEYRNNLHLSDAERTAVYHVYSQYLGLVSLANSLADMYHPESAINLKALRMSERFSLVAKSIVAWAQAGNFSIAQPTLDPETQPSVAKPSLRDIEITEEQLEALDVISRGLTIREAADHLSLPLGTVVGRQQRGFRNLDVNSSVAATIRLFERGLLSNIPEYETREPVYLTDRQQEIMNLVLEGLSDKAISEKLDLSVSYITSAINQISRANGFKSRVEAVRYFLQTGGPKTKDRTITFLEGAEEITPSKYGVYSKWMAKVFIEFPERPITIDDTAKVLYGESYSEDTKGIYTGRAGALLQAGLRKPGERRRISTIDKQLAQKGLRLVKYEIFRGRIPVSIFVGWPIDKEFDEEALDESLKDDELRMLAISLRKELPLDDRQRLNLWLDGLPRSTNRLITRIAQGHKIKNISYSRHSVEEMTNTLKELMAQFKARTPAHLVRKVIEQKYGQLPYHRVHIDLTYNQLVVLQYLSVGGRAGQIAHIIGSHNRNTENESAQRLIAELMEVFDAKTEAEIVYKGFLSNWLGSEDVDFVRQKEQEIMDILKKNNTADNNDAEQSGSH